MQQREQRECVVRLGVVEFVLHASRGEHERARAVGVCVHVKVEGERLACRLVEKAMQAALHGVDERRVAAREAEVAVKEAVEALAVRRDDGVEERAPRRRHDVALEPRVELRRAVAHRGGVCARAHAK